MKRIGTASVRRFDAAGGGSCHSRPRVPMIGVVAALSTVAVFAAGAFAADDDPFAGLPLARPRWKVPLANHPELENSVRSVHERHLTLKQPVVPAGSAVVVGSRVMGRTIGPMIAIDGRTGKRVWDFPWLVGQHEPGRDKRLQLEMVHDRIWSDQLQNELATDGTNAYVITATWRSGRNVPLLIPGRPIGRGRQLKVPSRYNQLTALGLAQEGKLQWLAKDADAKQPEYRETYFLSTPVLHKKQLLILAEARGQLRLLFLTSTTGKVERDVPLLAAPGGGIFTDRPRSLAGGAIAVAGKLAICSSGLGEVVAVHVDTGKVAWRRVHRKPQLRPRLAFGRGRFGVPQPPYDRWQGRQLTVVGKTVLLTAFESNELLALALESGEVAWKQPRGTGVYVAPTDLGDDRFVLVHSDRLELRAVDGEVQHTVALQHVVAGRGFATGNYFFQPTTQPAVLKVDLNRGRIVGSVRMREPVGNLTRGDGEILSFGPLTIAAYHQIDALDTEVAARLATAPGDVWGRMQRARLQVTRGRTAQGLAALLGLREAHPDNEAIAALLADLLLEKLTTEPDAAYEIARRYEQRQGVPAAMYVKLVVAAGKRKQVEAAFQYIVTLVELPATRRPDYVHTAGVIRVRLDRWIRGQVVELRKHATPAEAQRMKAEVAKRLQEAIEDAAGNRVDKLREVLTMFE